MSHFAKVENGIVTQVIVAEESFFETFIDTTPGEWIQCSYNNNIRGSFAGIGYMYDKISNIFYAPQPFASWTLDENNNWTPPTAYPDDGSLYTWNEDTLTWDEVVEPV